MPHESDVSQVLVRDFGDGSTIVTSLIDSVAAVRSVDPIALPPLHDAVDTDALVTLVDSARSNERDVVVEFTYADCRVTVEGGGMIHVGEQAAGH